MCCTSALITILSLAHITAMTISITLNAEPRIMPSGATLTDLINQLDLDPRGVAIERNREIVPKSAWTGWFWWRGIGWSWWCLLGEASKL